MRTNNNIDKPLESAPTVKESIKVAEKDPMTHIQLELMNRIEQAFEEAKESGFTGSFDEWISTTPVEELKEIAKFSDGGSVDFTGLTPGQLKAIGARAKEVFHQANTQNEPVICRKDYFHANKRYATIT